MTPLCFRLSSIVAAIVVFVLSTSACRRSTPQWLKGNLHTHTNRNEGDTRPDRVAQFYRGHGYQFVALSDHNVYTDPDTLGVATDSFVLLGAEEVSAAQQIHIGAIGISRTIRPRREQSRHLLILDNVAAVREAGGIPVVHHPHLSQLSADELSVIPGGLFMLEITEGRTEGVGSRAEDPGAAEQTWDRLLTAGRPVLAVGADDAHYFEGDAKGRLKPGTAWIMVKSSGFDRNGILSALRRGDFYASTGVTLSDIAWDGRTLVVQIEPVAARQLRTVFVGAGGRVLTVSNTNPATYDAKPTDRYVRARIESDDGARAWTQPVWITDRPEFESKPTESPNEQGLLAAVNPVATGPVVHITELPSAVRNCDSAPENTAWWGERMLGERRSVSGGAYEEASRAWVVRGKGSGELRTVTGLLRRRYGEVIETQAVVPEVRGVDVRHVTFEYPAGYDGNSGPVRVAARVITLRIDGGWGEQRRLVATYVNYDKVDLQTRAVVFVANGGVGVRVGLGLVDGGASSGAALGRLAVLGVPFVTYDESGSGESSPVDEAEHHLLLGVSDLGVLDRVLLKHFGRVDLLGGCASLAPLLARHESQVKSAYVSGQCIPLWTRNDTAERTGGPFGSDSETDHPVFQGQFQWADFMLMAAQDGVDLAFALNAGGSGLGKAGVLTEVLPALRRFNVPYQMRGDDSDGDGQSEAARPLCNEYGVPDYVEFLKWSRGRGAVILQKP